MFLMVHFASPIEFDHSCVFVLHEREIDSEHAEVEAIYLEKLATCHATGNPL